MEISIIKSGTEITDGIVEKDAIYITLTDERPENHPECICINEERNIYALAPCMKKKAGEIISNAGLAHIAGKLDREIKEIKDWSCTYLFLSRKGDFVMKLTYDNGPLYLPYLHKDKHDELQDMANREFRMRQEINQLALFFGCLVSVKDLSNDTTRYEIINTSALSKIAKKDEAWKEPKPLLKRISSMTKYEMDLFKISHLWNHSTNRIKEYWSMEGLKPRSISRLASNAYDVFRWIDRKQAIDLATLDYNPYH